MIETVKVERRNLTVSTNSGTMLWMAIHREAMGEIRAKREPVGAAGFSPLIRAK